MSGPRNMLGGFLTVERIFIVFLGITIFFLAPSLLRGDTASCPITPSCDTSAEISCPVCSNTTEEAVRLFYFGRNENSYYYYLFLLPSSKNAQATCNAQLRECEAELNACEANSSDDAAVNSSDSTEIDWDNYERGRAYLEEISSLAHTLRDAQQLQQFASRRLPELVTHIRVMENWKEASELDRNMWETAVPLKDLKNELKLLTSRNTQLEAQIAELQPVFQEYNKSIPYVHSTFGMLPVSRLNRKLYQIDTGRPKISFVMNYYSRPWAIDTLVQRYQQCQDVVASELLVNVDNADEAEAWVKHVYPTNGFVVPIFSYNYHEARGYNRLASVARGDYVILVQDDVLPADTSCQWAVKLVDMFEKYPKLGVVGLNVAQIVQDDHRRYPTPEMVVYRDAGLNTSMQFVLLADFGPFAVRREAFMDVGGVDETFGNRGECAIYADFELTARMWSAGWEVAHSNLFNGTDDGHEGSTHKSSKTLAKCWRKNLQLGYQLFHYRYQPDVLRALEAKVIRLNQERLLLKNASDPEPWKKNPGICRGCA